MRSVATLLATALAFGACQSRTMAAEKPAPHPKVHQNPAPKVHTSRDAAPRNHLARHDPAPHPPVHRTGPAPQHKAPRINPPKVAVRKGGSGYHGAGGYRRSYGRGGTYARQHRYPNMRPQRYPVRSNAGNQAANARLKKLAKLKGDLEGLKPNLAATRDQKTRLAGDLMDLAEGPTRIDRGPVEQLASGLADSLGRRTRERFDARGMALYLRELMNSSGTARAQFKPAIARGEALFRAAGIDKVDGEDLANHLRDVLAAFNPAGGGGRF